MSGRLLDLTGRVFGRLTVLHREGTEITPNGTKRPVWLCLCICGVKHKVQGHLLRGGLTTSCGCYRRELPSPAKTHGMSKTPAYQSWRGMWERCTNPQHSSYTNYGGRGVAVWEGWRSFERFYLDMGPRPKGTSLDRFPDPLGNYEPTNCRWASSGEQARNTMRNVLITWQGETLCRKDWAKRLGLTHIALKVRIKRWGLDRAFTTPKIDVGRRPKKNTDANQ